MSADRFTVDTHLFRELGELLVGRDSTALTELIKNAYDADATSITVHAENLADPSNGMIVVSDNGLGMTREQFRLGFLRVASRLKEGRTRVSPRFKRRYTGAKGIGRLAAHKLASLLEVTSAATDPHTGRRLGGVTATINWKRVEQAETLDDVAAEAIRVQSIDDPGVPAGTTIKLRHLKGTWTPREIENFVTQAQSMRPPPFLHSAEWIQKSVGRPLLLRRVAVHSNRDSGPDWDLHLTGDLGLGDQYLESAAEAASWVLEISSYEGVLRAALAPTLAFARDSRRAHLVKRRLTPPPTAGFTPPDFQARLLVREGDWQTGSEPCTLKGRSERLGVEPAEQRHVFSVVPHPSSVSGWASEERAGRSWETHGARATGRRDGSIVDIQGGNRGNALW